MGILKIIAAYMLIFFVFAVFVYPVLRYLFARTVLYIRCRFLPKGCFLIPFKPFWAFMPRLWSKKPDFAIYCNNEIYLFKLYTFRRKRKRVIFMSPEKWEVANDFSVVSASNYRYQENNLIDNILSFKHNIKAPSYLVKYADKIMLNLKHTDVIRCIPTVLFLPAVNKMFIKNGGSLLSGDSIFYGIVVANFDYFKKIFKKNQKEKVKYKQKLQIKKAVKKAVKK